MAKELGRNTFTKLTSGVNAYDPSKLIDELKASLLAMQGYGEDFRLKRLEQHHVVLTSILDPFLQGRSLEEAAKIIKGVEAGLVKAGKQGKLVNNIENLWPHAKEIHVKWLGVHPLNMSETDLQGFATTDINSKGGYVTRKSGFTARDVEGGKGQIFAYQDEIPRNPKGGGGGYNISFNTKYKDGISLENRAKYANMSTEEVIQRLTGFVIEVKPELEKYALVAAALNPNRAKGRRYLQLLVNRVENGDRLLAEGLADVAANNSTELARLDALQKSLKEGKVLGKADAIALEKANELASRLSDYNNLGPVTKIKPGHPAYAQLELDEKIFKEYQLAATSQVKKSKQLDHLVKSLFGEEVGEKLLKSGQFQRALTRSGRKLAGTAQEFLTPANVLRAAVGTGIVAASTLDVQAAEQEAEENPTLRNKAQVLLRKGEQGVEGIQTGTGILGKATYAPLEMLSWGLALTDIGIGISEDPEATKALGKALVTPETYTEGVPAAASYVWENKEDIGRQIGSGLKNFAGEVVEANKKGLYQMLTGFDSDAEAMLTRIRAGEFEQNREEDDQVTGEGTEVLNP